MRQRKHERERKRQRGQYMTPKPLAREILKRISLQDCARILEPSCGDGSFLSAIAERLAESSYRELPDSPVDIIGIEIDPQLRDKSRALMEDKLSSSASRRWEVRRADFFKEYLESSVLGSGSREDDVLRRESFDLIVGNWYLRGVGGQPYFGREGITWPLVASRFNPRYLPPGYILDSGAPCAFVREGVDRDEIFFIIGWLLSSLANRILKTVINHTRNIQSKDFERMPYPCRCAPSEPPK